MQTETLQSKENLSALTLGSSSIWRFEITQSTGPEDDEKETELAKNLAIYATASHEIKKLMDKYISISITNSKYKFLFIFLRII
jgi:hypothetical protein